MTKPELFAAAKQLIERSHWLGQQSMQVSENGHNAIEKTRKLLNEISSLSAPQRKEDT
ncbi:hypothetical protein [uncultured Roseobacter sp.]|uniref:hypothetical protein n=1 Tax=uncultured Roseobacter sp. TaxID=114847 RepID=UPI002627F6A8|nr:hypothetical protein [uncultured Roseobacter sp.]